MPLVLSVGIVFFLNSFLLGSFLSRVPDVLISIGTGTAALGFALFAAPVGSLVVAPFVGRLIEARSPGWVTIAAGIGLSLGIGMIGFAENVVALGAVLFVFGMVNGCMEVGMNATADRIETWTGRRIISRCHGFWSLGFMSGSLLTGGLAQAGVGVDIHLAVVAVAGVAAVTAASRMHPAAAFRVVPPAPGTTRAPAFAVPNRATVGVCLLCVGVTLSEGGIYDWGAQYLRADIGSSPFLASAAYACFTLAMAAGRFGGDVVRARFAAAGIVRGCAVLTGLGLVGFVLSPNAWVAGAALAVMGVGVSLVFPIAVTAVSAKPGNPASNIAALSLSVMAALLTGPPVIGVVGEYAGLGVALLLMLPSIAMTFVFAGHAKTAPKVVVEAVVEPPPADDSATAA